MGSSTYTQLVKIYSGTTLQNILWDIFIIIIIVVIIIIIIIIIIVCYYYYCLLLFVFSNELWSCHAMVAYCFQWTVRF